MPREFDCLDCGIHVLTYAGREPPGPELCAVCDFLRTVEDPDQRDELRRYLLGEPDVER